MSKKSKNNKLDSSEVALVKAMIARKMIDQEIVAYFTRPNRSINHARISDIRHGRAHLNRKPATEQELDHFLATWPPVESETGLHIISDELLIKAREAMFAAIQCYNNPRGYFRSEVFIVLAVIAWTYLLHAHFRMAGVDYRHYTRKADGSREVQRTKHGAEKFWELIECLKAEKCPLEKAVKINLEFLLGIRHEIEHRMTTRIDRQLGPKLQACINFNQALKTLFGGRHGIDADFSLALQLSELTLGQFKPKTFSALPANVEAMQADFEDALTDETYNDMRYAFRVLFVPKIVNKRAQADEIIEFVKVGSEDAAKINALYFKETEREKYKPLRVVKLMRRAGFKNFNTHAHTLLWKAAGAKDPSKGFGVTLSDGQWYWYPSWVDYVKAHCELEGARFR